MRTPEQMYQDIRNWEMDAGESFLDYFSSRLNVANLLFWAMGKGYIDEDGFKEWERNDDSYISSDDIIFGIYPFSIIKLEDGDSWNEDGYERAMKVLAEFLASSKTYQKRVDNFLSNIDNIKFDDVLKHIFRDRIFYMLDGERVNVNRNTPLTIDVIQRASWYRDNNEYDEDNE